MSTVLILGPREEALHVFGWTEWPAMSGQISPVYIPAMAEAAAALEGKTADCVVLTGLDAGAEAVNMLEQIQNIDAEVPVIVASLRLSAAGAARLMRAGASHCFGPGDRSDDLLEAVETAAEERSRSRRNQTRGGNEAWRKTLVGESLAMESVAGTIRLISPRRSTVLITGETGTRKEMAARAIHMASPRAQLPMVAVNCSALPENLLEAELFGHTKGAFTGAATHRIGRFEQAHKSTIFLDEIGEMPLNLQAKLLRVLQERELQRLGSSETIRVDLRVLAATNLDLEEKVKQGRFREDLYYRLNVVPLRMPPLRSRVADIPDLAAHFVKKVCVAEGMPVKRLTPGALHQLCAYSWPGNVRQLENAVEMAVALSGESDVLHPGAFGFGSAQPARVAVDPGAIGIQGDEAFETAVNRFQLVMMENALRDAGGNKTAAAERLGMKRTTLLMKMRKLQPLMISLAC